MGVYQASQQEPMRGAAMMPGVKSILVVVTGLVAGIPGAIRDAALVLSLFILLDTLTGFVVAAKCGAVRSRKMREQFASKLAQYAGIIGIGGGAAVLSHQSAILGCSMGACIAMEFVSIIENVNALEKCGGAHLGPARPILEKLERFFALPETPASGRDETAEKARKGSPE